MEQQQTMNKKLIIFPIIMFFCVVFMSVGYASITNDLLVVSGQVSANSQTGVFITDIDYANDTDAVLANSNIRDYIGTTMHSNIELSANNHNSLITYDITV